MNRILVYTAQFCGRDADIAEPVFQEGVDYVCFTDDPPERKSLWQFRPPFWCDPDPRRAARMHKLLGLELFCEYSSVLWLDGSLELIKFPESLLISSPTIACFPHRQLDCLYREAELCQWTKRAPIEDLDRQVQAYQQHGFPEHAGLFETGFLWRHNHAKLRSTCRKWWYHLDHYTIRDQISLPFVSWRTGTPITPLPGTLANNPWVKLTPHDYLPDDKYLDDIVAVHRPDDAAAYRTRLETWRSQWGRFSSLVPAAAAPPS